MKASIIIAACIISATALFIAYKDQPPPDAMPFRMIISEHNGNVAAVIPIGDTNRLYVLGKNDGDQMAFSSVAYQLDGHTIFSHSDTNDDGEFDELNYIEPPFDSLRLYIKSEDGAYSMGSDHRHNEVTESNLQGDI